MEWQSFWHEWRGSLDGRPALWIRRIFEVRGWRLQLHKFTRADDPGCFHTHPARAYRLILWGGYWEERLDGHLFEWRPLRFGSLEPSYCHRVERLLNGRSSWSLWLRGPKTHAVELHGDGWPIEARPE